MVLTTYLVTPGLKTAALDGALLVFHPGSGATVALTDDLLDIFQAIAAGRSDLEACLSPPVNPTPDLGDEPAMLTAADTVDNCLRLLRQQQLIQLATP